MTRTDNDEQLYMMFLGYVMRWDYRYTSTPEKPSEPSEDEQGSEDEEVTRGGTRGFAPSRGVTRGFAPSKGVTRGVTSGGGARRGPQTDQDKGLLPAGDDRLQREWPTEDRVPLTAGELKLYMPDYGWALRCIRTGEVFRMQWAPCTTDDNKAVSNLASNMQEAFNEAWQGAKDVSDLPQQAAVLPCGDFKLQCTDVNVLMRGGEYDVVMMETPFELFCQLARPVTCIIATQKQLLAMSMAHNAAVALVKPQKETWFHESFYQGVKLTKLYDNDGWLNYEGDSHGFMTEYPFGRDITSMTNAEKICSETESARLRPLDCFTGKTVGSNPEGGPFMDSVSGLTAEKIGKKTKQTSITSAFGPPLLLPGHGLVVMVSLQAEMQVFRGDNSECEICLESNPICLTSCGHARVCRGCVERIGHDTKKPCPMCRQDIHWAVEVKTDTTPEVEERPPKTEVKTDTTPEVEERPPKTAKLSQIEEELDAIFFMPASNGAAAGASSYEIRQEINDSDDELDELMFGGSTRPSSPEFDWKTIPEALQNEYWDLVDKMGFRLGGKYDAATVWATLLTLPKDDVSGLTRVARISDQFQ